MVKNPNMFGEFKIYPRGFLGANLGIPITKILKPYEDKLTSHQYHTDMFNSTKDNGAGCNPNVEALYAHYIKNSADTNSFTFHEKVLTVALAAFGTTDFGYWFKQQHNSPATGDLHRRFLEDTLKFISTGRREMCLENYCALLTLSDIDGNICELTDFAKDFFKYSGSGQDEVTTLINIIQKWCSQPNGFEDMLGTLHILFGNVSI